MPEEINIGDTVCLKSGGPLMTVTLIDSVDGRSRVWCTWFDKNEDKNGNFPLEGVRIESDS